jgi:hypothetical protein
MPESRTIALRRRQQSTQVNLNDRLAVAELLADQSPLPGTTAAAALGWTLDRWWRAVERYTGWFGLTGKGWVILPAGLAVVEERKKQRAA